MNNFPLVHLLKFKYVASLRLLCRNVHSTPAWLISSADGFATSNRVLIK